MVPAVCLYSRVKIVTNERLFVAPRAPRPAHLSALPMQIVAPRAPLAPRCPVPRGWLLECRFWQAIGARGGSRRGTRRPLARPAALSGRQRARSRWQPNPARALRRRPSPRPGENGPSSTDFEYGRGPRSPVPPIGGCGTRDGGTSPIPSIRQYTQYRLTGRSGGGAGTLTRELRSARRRAASDRGALQGCVQK